MKKDVIEICYELSDEIKTSPVYLRLQNLEQQIKSDSLLLNLQADFVACQEALVRLDEYGREADKSEARKALSKAKYQLDVHPLMIEYNEQIKALNLIFDEINAKVFHRFKASRSCKI